MAENNSAGGRWRGLRDRFLYQLKRVFAPVAPSTTPGMGAIVHPNGTAFRVWAPHAERVFVTGSFNRWSPWRTPLAPEGNGYWSADVPQARPGDTYKYVIHNHSLTLLRTDPYARDVSPPYDNGVICADGFDWDTGAPPYQTPGWHELVIYELHTGTFRRRPGDDVGTLKGVVDKLPYLRDLGINAIELMPVAAFPGEHSWGYNPAHPFAVTRVYGGRDALKELIKAAHAHHIAVILDVVYNHFGPDNLSLWQFDGWQENNLGGIYFYNDWRSETPWGHTRPDYGRPEVRQFIRDNVFMWLEEFRVDGLRWDTTNYIRNVYGNEDSGADIQEGRELLRWINGQIDARQPWKINIAEDLQRDAWVTREVDAGGAGFDSQWDARFAHHIRRAVATPRDDDRDMEVVRDAIACGYNGDVFERVLYTESHDEVANGKTRIPEEITPGEPDSLFAKKRSTLGAALVFTAPGIPMIFQGQEFLESGWFDDHVPLDWGKSARNKGILRMYRQLIRLRRNWHNNTRGLTGQHVNVYHVNNRDKLVAFHRWDQGGPRDDVVVVANMANRAQQAYTLGFPRAGIWRVRFNSDERIYDPGFGQHLCPDVVAAPKLNGSAPAGMPCWGNVTLAPYAVLILSQD